jgi:hypothetical protein
MTGVRFDCRFATGETALHRLDQVLCYLLARGAKFVLMRELARPDLNTPNFNMRGSHTRIPAST